VGRVMMNKRMRVCVGLSYIAAYTFLDIFGIILLTFAFLGFVSCWLPTDVKYYIVLLNRLSAAWEQALDAKDLPEDMSGVRVSPKKRSKFACKLAIRAISKVGLLRPTEANAKVYQKVILDDMKVLNVRFAHRVEVLPLAIAACLERPAEVRKVEECIKWLLEDAKGH